MKVIYYLFALFLSILFISCGVTDTETINKPVEPGRRDYVWEVDTLNTSGGTINCIWGSSPTDVWAAGNSPYVSHSEIWHYDGLSWNMFTDISYTWNPSSLFGFSKNDIWIGGGGGYFYHYEGNKWSISQRFVGTNINCMTVRDIWGDAPNNIYATCDALKPGNNKDVSSLILHYDGFDWKEVFRNDTTIQYYTIRGYKKNLYIVGETSKFDGSDYYKIYEFSNNSMKEIFSGKCSQVNGCNLEIIGDELYFVIWGKINELQNETFTEVLKLEYENYAGYACGRNEKDIFFFMNDGIVHYNGTNYQYIYEFSLNEIMLFNDPVIMDNDIFITAVEITGNKNRIIHGHLPN